MNILFVEDNYLLAKGTARILQQLGGHRVHVTDDPGAIAPLCEATVINLLLIDIYFLGGLFYHQEIQNATLTKFLQTNLHTVHIPVIWVTSYASSKELHVVTKKMPIGDICPQPLADYSKLLELIQQTADSSLHRIG